jgi:hypothetical protein
MTSGLADGSGTARPPLDEHAEQGRAGACLRVHSQVRWFRAGLTVRYVELRATQLSYEDLAALVAVQARVIDELHVEVAAQTEVIAALRLKVADLER